MKGLSTLLLLSMTVCSTLVTSAQVRLENINVPYEQNFDELAATGTANEVTTLPTGWTFLETGANADSRYAAGTGSSNAGNTYSFGASGSGERALGGLLSGSLTPVLGASFVNATGSVITSMEVTYTGEQWRLGALNRGADQLDFQYSFDATSINSGTWTDLDILDFQSSLTTGTVGAKNGNDSLHRIVLSATLEGLFIPEGQTFSIRWLDVNVSGADDGLAIDDFVLTPYGIPSTEPSIIFNADMLNFGSVPVNTSVVLNYIVKGMNLEEPVQVSVDTNSSFTVSADGISFGSSVSLPDSGGIVHVRFTPLSDGWFVDSVFHVSGGLVSTLMIDGYGYDPSVHIMPIALARSMGAGEVVTVAGRITVADELGNPVYVQDLTGGIPVFDFTLMDSVEIGDSVIVTGPIGFFMEQVQISGVGIFFTKPDNSKRFVTPEIINLDSLFAFEGWLVTVTDVELTNPDFVFYPQTTVQITDGITIADMRIDGDTDIPGLTKPQGAVNVTGVVGRFRSNMQLLPRFNADIPGAMDPGTPHDTVPRTATFDVVTWNLEFFGAASEDYGGEEFGPADEALQSQNVKTILENINADIIAVQEVSDEVAFMQLVSQLRNYDAVCSDRYSYSFDGPDDAFPPQKVCFIYDTTTVAVISARSMFEALYDSARTVDPSRLPGYPTGNPSSFYSSGRLPFMLTVNAAIEGASERIILVAMHGKSGANSGDYDRRLYDAMVLKDSLDNHFSNEKIIILGDFNDDLDNSIAAGLPSPYEAFVNDTSWYMAVTKALSDAGAKSTIEFGDVIDHQIISNGLRDVYMNGSAQVIAPFGQVYNYGVTTSDHLPVITRYAWNKPAIGFVHNALVVSEGTENYTVELTIDEPLQYPAEVTIAIHGDATYGADFNTTPAATDNLLKLTIPAGINSASFTVQMKEDVIDEFSETAAFTILPSSGFTITDSVFAITIEDNDVPVISFASLYASGAEGSGDHEITLKMSTPPVTDQTVTIQLFNGPGVGYGTDYSVSPAPAGNEIDMVVPAGASEAVLLITPHADTRRELLLELVTFYLAGTSSGLQAGLFRISAFIIIDVKRSLHFAASPNPVHHQVVLRCDVCDPDQTVVYELRDPDGIRISFGKGTLSSVSAGISERLRYTRKGIYILTITADNDKFILRLLKQ